MGRRRVSDNGAMPQIAQDMVSGSCRCTEKSFLPNCFVIDSETTLFSGTGIKSALLTRSPTKCTWPLRTALMACSSAMHFSYNHLETMGSRVLSTMTPLVLGSVARRANGVAELARKLGSRESRFCLSGMGLLTWYGGLDRTRHNAKGIRCELENRTMKGEQGRDESGIWQHTSSAR